MAKATSQVEQHPKLPLLTVPEGKTILVSPILYAMILPLVLFDLCLEIYQRTTFPILRIPMIRRQDFIKIDRYRLPYLPFILKLACSYCGYANGLLQYATRIAGETEAHFCPIKHAPNPTFHIPSHHRKFAEYGDKEDFYQHWESKQEIKKNVDMFSIKPTLKKRRIR